MDMEKITQEAITNVPVGQDISWIDRLIIWIDQRPWPAWLFYAALWLVSELLLNVAFWVDGSVPVGEHVTLPSVSPVLYFLGLALYHYLSKAGSRALRDFRPLLEADDDDIASIDKALNFLPPRTNWFVLLLAITGSLLYVFGSPNTYGDIVPRSILPTIIIYIISVATVIPFFSQMIRIVRQVRILQDLHERASNINLLHLEPAHAFARLTAKTGGGLILLQLLGTLYNRELAAGVNLPGTIAVVFFAALIFIAPLIGLRNRLIKEKVQRQDEISGLLQLTFEQVHDKARNHADIDIAEANSTMSALTEERALIEKVSTWPWDTGTIRGFASTLLLPILLWLITRVLERYF
jgi:hypothetical protein